MQDSGPDPQSTLDYLRTSLERAALRELSPQEETLLRNEGQKKFLYSQLLSKRFRKWAVEPTANQRVLTAIDRAVDHQKPLQLIHVMGGYKFWKLPSTPEVDWAEFFNVAYLLRYLSGIAAGYEPGVSLHYYMYTLLPQTHDNLTEQEVRAYVNSFQVLLNAFSEHLPGNVSLSLCKDADFYTPEEYFSLIDEAYTSVEQKFSTLPEAAREELLRWSRNNIKWAGARDWTRLTESEREEKIRRGAIYEVTGLARMNRPHRFTLADDKILLFPKPRKGTDVLGLGSTRSSIAKFWMGVGVLEHRDGAFHDIVLSPTQLEKTTDLPQSTFECELLPLRNLRRIKVITQHLNFSGRG